MVLLRGADISAATAKGCQQHFGVHETIKDASPGIGGGDAKRDTADQLLKPLEKSN